MTGEPDEPDDVFLFNGPIVTRTLPKTITTTIQVDGREVLRRARDLQERAKTHEVLISPGALGRVLDVLEAALNTLHDARDAIKPFVKNFDLAIVDDPEGWTEDTDLTDVTVTIGDLRRAHSLVTP